MLTPKNGSEQATMRSTVLPSAITAASRLKMPTIFGAKANSSAPERSISPTSHTRITRA